MIKLTALNYERPIWVNPNLITCFESREGGTVIYFDQDNEVKVKETNYEICELLQHFWG